MPVNPDALLERIWQINAGIEIRQAKPKDAEAFSTLMNRYYARKKSNSSFLWQYFSSEVPAVIFMAFDSGKLAGMYGLQLRDSSVGLCGGFAIDSLVDEAYRQTGLFILLEHEATNYAETCGAQFMAALPNRTGMSVRSGRMGWKTLAQISTLYLSVPSSISARQSNHETDLEQPNIFFTKNSNKYYNWRYIQNPNYKYKSVTLDTSVTAITKIFIDPMTGVRYGDIVDFECSLDDGDKLEALFQKACIHLTAQGVESITTWALPHTLLYNILLDNGFNEKPEERYFCIKTLNPEFEYLNQIHNWHLVQSDSEIY